MSVTFKYGTTVPTNKDGYKLPCFLIDRGCTITYLEIFAYTWSTRENCVLTNIQTQKAGLLMELLNSDQKGNQFFFSSEFTDSQKNGTNLQIKVFAENREFCRKLEKVYKTKFESISVSYQRNFAIPSGEVKSNALAFNVSKFSVDNTSHKSYTTTVFGKVNGKRAGDVHGVLCARMILIMNRTCKLGWIRWYISMRSN